MSSSNLGSGFLPPTASPMRGPRRYLPINQECSSREAAEVELRSQQIMKGLQQKSAESINHEEINQDPPDSTAPPSPRKMKQVQEQPRHQSPGKSQVRILILSTKLFWQYLFSVSVFLFRQQLHYVINCSGSSLKDTSNVPGSCVNVNIPIFYSYLS